jgi:hypothetical protein
MPSLETVYKRLREDPKFLEVSARAREDQGDTYADKVSDLEKRTTAKNANAMRVRIEALKWMAGVRRPRRYGARIDQDEDRPPIEIDRLRFNEYARRIAFTLWAGNRDALQPQRALPAPRPAEVDITPGIRPKDDE